MTFPFPFIVAAGDAAPPSVTWGALVKKSANQTAVDFTSPTILTFDTEVYDNGGWHDAGDNTKLTVPSGISYVRVIAQIKGESLGTSNDSISIRVLKDGSAISPQVKSFISTGVTTTPANRVVSYPIAVTAGNYFQLEYTVGADASSDITAAETWFAIEKVE